MTSILNKAGDGYQQAEGTYLSRVMSMTAGRQAVIEYGVP